MPDYEEGSLLHLAEQGDLHPEVAAQLRESADRRPHHNAKLHIEEHGHPFSEAVQELIGRLGVTTYGEGLDFSGAPTGAFGGMRASGRNFVCMYTKWVGRGGFEAARAAGLRPVPIYETTGVDYRGGRPSGQNAARAHEAWCNYNGYPGAEVYNTFDEDVGDFGLAGAYEDGWHDVIGFNRTDGYAKSQLISWLLSNGKIRRGWVTYAWSGGALDERATLYQNPNDITVAGVNCDRDRAFQPTIGAIGEGPAPAPTPPAPPKHKEENDMYRSLAPGDPPLSMPLPIFEKGALILTSDGGGINDGAGVPVRAAIRNENGAWVPVLGSKPNDPGLGPDPFVSWFPGGDKWVGLDGTGGLVVIENLSEARKAALGVDPSRFPAGNSLGVSVVFA